MLRFELVKDFNPVDGAGFLGAYRCGCSRSTNVIFTFTDTRVGREIDCPLVCL